VNFRLIVKLNSSISRVSDLKGNVVAHKGGGHPGLNVWLYFKQHGLEEEKGNLKLLVIKEEAVLWQAVQEGKVDAAIVPPPHDVSARKAGLKSITVDPLPMIEFTTLSTGLPFVEKHPDIVERFIKGVIEGIAYFKTRKNEAIKIIQRRYKSDGDVNEEMARYLYDELDQRLPRKPYAAMQAILNAYELAVRQDRAAEKVNPMELWDFHYLRRIDDSGFIDKLYQG
jgi:sulfonate transport system substrate-binding protein